MEKSRLQAPGDWAAYADHATVENRRRFGVRSFRTSQKPIRCPEPTARNSTRAPVSAHPSGFARGGAGAEVRFTEKVKPQARFSAKSRSFSVRRAGANRALFSLWLLSLLSKRKRESDTFPRLGSGTKLLPLLKGTQLSDFKSVPLTVAVCLPCAGGDHQGLCGRPWMLRKSPHLMR